MKATAHELVAMMIAADAIVKSTTDPKVRAAARIARDDAFVQFVWGD